MSVDIHFCRNTLSPFTLLYTVGEQDEMSKHTELSIPSTFLMLTTNQIDAFCTYTSLKSQ